MQVSDLRAQLGAAAVPCPATDIGSSFEAIANKALGITGFYPYNSDTNFLLGMPCYAWTPESCITRACCVVQLSRMMIDSHAMSHMPSVAVLNVPHLACLLLSAIST